jgi:hypothetical protein
MSPDPESIAEQVAAIRAETPYWWRNPDSRDCGINWRTVIAPTLARLFPGDLPQASEEHFRPLWQRPCR